MRRPRLTGLHNAVFEGKVSEVPKHSEGDRDLYSNHTRGDRRQGTESFLVFAGTNTLFARLNRRKLKSVPQEGP